APAELARCEPFVRQYYRWVPGEDLAELGADDLAGAALALWSFVQRRAAGETKIRIYNPRGEQHGWQSPRTVIEILSDDMPFLVDSVTMELRRRGVGIHLMIHPVLSVARQDDGELRELLAPGRDGGAERLESVLHLEVDRETDAAALASLAAGLEGVLAQVRAAVEDWQLMRRRASEIAASLATTSRGVAAEEVEDSREFLEWLARDHFTFLGARDYDLVTTADGEALLAVEGTGLGILRDDGTAPTPVALSKSARAIALAPRVLVLTKANTRATVHRPSFLDYVGVKLFDEDGHVTGERRFLGLYTTLAYKEPALEIPILRGKLAYVLEHAGFAPDSHDRKALLDILESYRPRDELLQINEAELFATAMGILAIGERQRVRLFVHPDPFERFVSCLVFVPRDRFNTEARERIGSALCEAFSATLQDWSLLFSESVLVRVHYVLGIEHAGAQPPDTAALEARLVEITSTWSDELRDGLTAEFGEEQGGELHRRYADAFPTAYRAEWPARAAIADIERAEEAVGGGGLGISLYREGGTKTGIVRCKLFSADLPVSLSDVLPMFENMGARIIDERPYAVTPRGSAPLWIYDLGLSTEHIARFDTIAVRVRFQEAFLGVWQGLYENDGLNRLVLDARLRGREVMVLRAITKYLRQAGTALSDGYLQQALIANAEIVQLLVTLFRARFDPDRRDDEEAARVAATIEWAIDAVESLEADRILRDYLSVMRAMTRTDYFQAADDGAPKNSLCFKLDPARLPLLPSPRPRFEIFVYSPRVEGVHLRGGRIARGGLRWSDRREDFRTEVLGLMKAQMVKNAVIVPFGAKGGFVVKDPPSGADPEALHEEVVACYQAFVSSLLDITDNIVGEDVVPPRDVIRHDGDDPYLVVAADKGTASFSDIANTISAAHSYWLGDAFASGGSVGYDHKKMGITARGAWESVQRHFRELGRNIMAADFTVVGIGDMSGDVFGNGMLRSPHIRLLGAFNHAHIFLDPDPDPVESLAERRRLFELPASSWSDYDQALISPGGGAYPRSAKSIQLSEQARAMLDVEQLALTPDELIRALLRAPVDLLWNGGIGTYVKASLETNVDVGDKSNDAVRVDGRELRCRVVGEGGNLGLTQRGRIEYAFGGGFVNTDAIDNVGGVNCSDREVNLKILLDAAVRSGELSVAERNELLVQMTDAVAALVLRDSYTQTQALSLALSQAPQMLDVHARMIRQLEQTSGLERANEALPDEDEIAARRLRERGLTSPELAVLLAHAKITLNAALVESDLPEDPYLSGELDRYFPPPLPERFAAQLGRHRLRREIITTQVTNDFVDTAGVTSAFRLIEETGTSPAHLARAYIAAREVFELRDFWARVEALDNIADAHTQIELLREGRKLVERATRWLVRNRNSPLDIAATIGRFANGVAALTQALPAALEGSDRDSYDELLTRFEQGNVPATLASRAAAMGGLLAALDIVEVAGLCDRATEAVTSAYFRLGSRVGLHWLRDRMNELPRSSRWQSLARAALRDDLGYLQRTLTAEVLLASPPGVEAARAIELWEIANAESVARCTRVLAEIRATRTYDVTTLSVALREARNLLHEGASNRG
ncbi:MAG TPA: NAD-glutamate dehydrogenase, partial [Solirubrobacteraceae bacterium]|nr:NAD-glutamate dehydrogenase [Solirubrobacteraceae bacterium]